MLFCLKTYHFLKLFKTSNGCCFLRFLESRQFANFPTTLVCYVPFPPIGGWGGGCRRPGIGMYEWSVRLVAVEQLIVLNLFALVPQRELPALWAGSQRQVRELDAFIKVPPRPQEPCQWVGGCRPHQTSL